MLRALFVLAGVMSLGGLAAMVNGASIILNERGWSQFIAGYVILSGGCVVLALAACLMEWRKQISMIAGHSFIPKDHAHHSAEHQDFNQAAASVPKQANIPIGGWTQASAPSSAPSDPILRAGEGERAVDRANAIAPFDPGTYPVDFTTSHDGGAGHVGEERRPPGALPPAPPPSRPIVSSAPSSRAATSRADQTVPSGVDPLLSRALSSGSLGQEPASPPPVRDSRPVAAPPKQPSLFEVVQDQQAQHQAQSAPVRAPYSASIPQPNLSQSPLPQASATAPSVSAAATPTEPRVLVASYSTGGVGYFMYSDQSIEAEMAIGRYRFQSMEELRQFIETHQGGVKVSD
mgnify:CR=1 FL=1